MVLMEKALSWMRQDVREKTFRSPGECTNKISGVGGCGNNTINHLTLDLDYEGTDVALIHVTGGNNKSLGDAATAAEAITDKMNEDSMVIWGNRIDPSLGNQKRAKLVLTGIKSSQLIGGYEMEEEDIFNLEPFAGPEKIRYDLGLDLYDMESSWK